MKKVLIITYYWPPSGGAGVQRWLKFSKYLPENGWQPIIYTPENPDFSLKDSSLEKDIPKEAIVLKTKIWEPYNLYKSLLGKKGESANAGFFASDKVFWKQKLSIYIRGNFFIPDPRVFWVKPSIKHLSKYLKENPVNAIISTGPPHSMHLIALGLKKRFPNINWLADFRDPWTEIDFYQDLNLTKRSDRKHHKLEEEVVKSADKVVTVSKHMQEQFSQLKKNNVEVVRNGYDEDDFADINNIEIDKSKFTIVHVGSMNKDRNHEAFWSALFSLKADGVIFKLKLIGSLDQSVFESIKSHQLENEVEVISYLKHEEAILEMKKASLLYLSINNVPSAKGIVTGKVFEYIAVEKPILVVGPKEGEIKEMLPNNYSSFEDVQSIKENIIGIMNSNNEKRKTNFEQFSRRKLTKDLVQILENN